MRKSRRPLPASSLRSLGLAALAIGLSQVACGATPWQPPPPAGQTYEYDYQGFRGTDTTVVAGGGAGGPAYAGVFAFREAKGVHEEAGGKEPFSQSAPIDGYRFNTHLGAQGAQLSPGSAMPPGIAGGGVSVSASASVKVEAKPPVKP